MIRSSSCLTALRFLPSKFFKSCIFLSEKEEVKLHPKSNICNFRWKDCYFWFRTDTSSHPRCSIKKVVLKNYAIFTGKHLCLESLFNTVAGLGLQHRCFPVNIAKFLRIGFLHAASQYFSDGVESRSFKLPKALLEAWYTIG